MKSECHIPACATWALFLAVFVGRLPDARAAASDLWFHADFDSPTTVAGEVFPFAMPTNFLAEGKFGRGYRFTCPGKGKPNLSFNRGDPRNGNCFNTDDPRLLASYPVEAGTFACWLKCDLNVSMNSATPLFSHSGWWQTNWTLDRGRFVTSGKRGASVSRGWRKNFFERRADWMHVACTWNREKIAVYVDGVCVATNKTVDLQKVAKGTLRIGSGTQATGAAEGVMDEIAIYRRTLTADEVKALAAAKEPILKPQWLLGGIDFTTFFRDQTNAALRTRLHVPAAGRCTVTGSVGPIALAPVTREFAAGDTLFAVPFEPGRLRPGKYPWKFVLKPEGADEIVRSGELEIRPRLDRDAFRFHSWGPDAPYGYSREMGFNQMMTSAGDIEGARRIVNAGFFVNLRYENSGAWRKLSPWRPAHSGRSMSDYSAITEQAKNALSYAAGLWPWKYTLVNSEVYSLGAISSLTNNAPFLAEAEAELGFKPVVSLAKHPPAQLDRKRQGKKPIRGVFDPKDEPDYATLKWFGDGGHPTLRVNRANCEAVHSLDPDGIVWSEPSFGAIAGSVDLFADWNYCYSETETLWEYRTQYAGARAYGRGFQPTLSSGYYHGGPGRAYYPNRTDAKGKSVPCEVTQSADECAIKAMCALGAVRTETLSWFCAKDWSSGEVAATNYLAGGTNTYRKIADVGTGRKYGEFMRKRFFPAADLLRGMITVRAPVAYVAPFAGAVAGGMGWGHYHFGCGFKGVLAQQPVPFDVLTDREMTAENLSQYKLVFLMAATALEKEQDAALCAAAEKGTRIVTDGYACKTFAGGVALTNLVYNYYKHEKMFDPLRDFCRETMPSLVPTLGASSEGDGKTAFTFEKEQGGVRYVMVVNNARRPHDAADGILTTFCTNATYRPYGAPQRIVTTIRNVPEDAAVYEYNAGEGELVQAREGSVVTLTADYGAAETRIFVVRPRPVDDLEAEVVSSAENLATLRVTILDESGKPAPGRSVVSVTVTDPDGRLDDSSGRYRVENGVAEIPIRRADDDPKGGFFSRWKAVVTDLASGESETIRFRF